MKLNKTIPGFPEWPTIKLITRKNEYLVYGWHASYGRYVFASWLFNLALYGSFAFAAWSASTRKEFGPMVLTFFFTLGPLTIVSLFFSNPKLITRLFLRKKTCVRIRQDEIVVDKKRFAIVPGVNIQFRAFSSVISERKARRLLSKGVANDHQLYPLEFRKVEMIYGARVIEVASMDDEDRAEQFAVALQIGLEKALTQKAPAVAPKASARNAAVEDALPE